MADFFGGIFDSVRSVGDDISGFFDTSLGQALGKGAKTLFSSDSESGKSRPSLNENFVPVGSENFNRSPDIGYAKSNDFYQTEYTWLKRLDKFRNLVKETEVKK